MVNEFQVHIGYQKPKSYILTPHRKRIGKAVARKSHKEIAVECMKNKFTCQHAIRLIGNKVKEEIRAISSSSVALVYQSKNSIKWSKFISAVSTCAPTLLSLLTSATKTRGPRCNQSAVIGMCFALLLKHRNPKLNLVQKIISLILYAGHCSKQVAMLCVTLICMHNNSLLPSLVQHTHVALLIHMGKALTLTFLAQSQQQ